VIRSLVIFCDKQVGFEVIEHLLHSCPQVLSFVVLTEVDRRISGLLRRHGFHSDCILRASALNRNLYRLDGADLFVLAWWPLIIKKEVLTIPRLGTINLHPSLLPYNRGKHYNFWSIVEECPFGVSLHFAEEAVDSGDIVAQRAIKKTWKDTGESLYFRAQSEIVKLFKETLPVLLSGEIPRHPQPRNKGSFHYAHELATASRIDLETNYKARDLLNLLRARTFPPHPACYFDEGGTRYEVRISIAEVEE
jgi:methionyl-tRNA formyltransferase